jgi:hypothetical protein
LRSFFNLSKTLLTQNHPVEFRQAGGLDSQVVYFPIVRRITNYSKTRGGRSAIQKPLNGRKLSARHLASMGKIQGTLCISGPINLRKCKSGDHALGPARAQQRLSICVFNHPFNSVLL